MMLALGAGALSFLSPCVLPIFPAYLSYITGISGKELQEEQTAKIRRSLLSHSSCFLLGVSLVFISLAIGASFLGKWIHVILTGHTGLRVHRTEAAVIVCTGVTAPG